MKAIFITGISMLFFNCEMILDMHHASDENDYRLKPDSVVAGTQMWGYVYLHKDLDHVDRMTQLFVRRYDEKIEVALDFMYGEREFKREKILLIIEGDTLKLKKNREFIHPVIYSQGRQGLTSYHLIDQKVFKLYYGKRNIQIESNGIPLSKTSSKIFELNLVKGYYYELVNFEIETFVKDTGSFLYKQMRNDLNRVSKKYLSL